MEGSTGFRDPRALGSLNPVDPPLVVWCGLANLTNQDSSILAQCRLELTRNGHVTSRQLYIVPLFTRILDNTRLELETVYIRFVNINDQLYCLPSNIKHYNSMYSNIIISFR